MSLPVTPVDIASPVSSVGANEQRFAIQSPSSKEASPAPVDPLAAVKSVGERIDLGNRSAIFSYDSATKRVIVKIVTDSKPPEVVRQIPSEDYLSFVTKVRELFGVMFDQQL